MKQFLINTLKKASAKAGITMLRTPVYEELVNQRDKLLKQCVVNSPTSERKGLVGVVFSMDRPIQLYAILESYLKYNKNPAPLYVLHASSSNEFLAGYKQLIEEFSGKNINFIEEKCFDANLTELLCSLKEDNIFFLVDDCVFVREYDMHNLMQFNPLEEIVSLRLAPYYTRSYTMSIDQLPPVKLHPSSKYENMLEWNWGDDDAGNEWAYPMSVDMHLFDRREIVAMTKAASFKAPNTYENALMTFYSAVKGRKGFCYKQQYLFNNPCNKVQSENANLAGNISPKFLLDKWNNGFKIDLEPFDGLKTKGPHEEYSLVFTKR